MWTGPTVCSPTVTADDARGWIAAVARAPHVRVGQHPVNDAHDDRTELHLGPYDGRDADLVDLVGGVLLQPDDAGARVAGGARHRDGASCAIPTGTTPRRRGARRSRTSAATAPRRSRVLAGACADGPLPIAGDARARPARRRARQRALDGPGLGRRRVARSRPSCRGARALPDAFATEAGDELAAEVAPWAAAARAEAAAGLAALRLLQGSRAGRRDRRGDRGRAAAPDAEPPCTTRFALIYIVDGRACR